MLLAIHTYLPVSGGFLNALPWGILQFNESKSLSMILINIAVASLFSNSGCLKTMFRKSMASSTESHRVWLQN